MRGIANSNDPLADTLHRPRIKAGDPVTVAEGEQSMDNELKQYLEGMEARMFATFATKEDLARFATKEDLERVETSLLTEFHKWASPADMRLKSHALAIRATDLEMEALAERVQKLEGKKAS